MSQGGLSVFLALLFMFFVSFLIMSGIRLFTFFVFPDPGVESLGELSWRVFFQILDSGSLAELDSGSEVSGKLVGILTIFVGLILFSSMVALITQEFEKRMSILRKGKSNVIEFDHTLIIGFGDRLVNMIEELVLANESESDAVVVVLADMDKDVLDDYLREHLTELKTTRVITRSGSTTSLKNLKMAGIHTAQSVVVMNDSMPSEIDEKKGLSDARVIKSIMAVLSATGEEELPSIVAEVHLPRYRELAENIVEEGKITTLNEADILARMLVQTSRSEGLSMVYSDLVGYEGNEFYFFRPDSGWNQLSFGALQFHFMQSVPLGVRTSEGKLLLNPDTSYMLQDDDEAVILAEDDSTIAFYEAPVHEPRSHEYPTERITPCVERHLIIGWSTKTPIVLREYAAYVSKGSEVSLIVSDLTLDIQVEVHKIAEEFPHVTMDIHKIDLGDFEKLKTLDPMNFTAVSILAESGNSAEEIDSKTIMLLLQFRRIFREYRIRTQEEITTKLITEVIDSGNSELVLTAGVRDFLLSNQFVSKIFAQISQDPDVMKIYEDLFSEEGSEVYVKSIHLYFKHEDYSKASFGDCVLAAQARQEVCFGVKIASQEHDALQDFGIYLIPNKTTVFSFELGDALITLAEDDT